MNLKLVFPKASPQHRLGGLALEMALLVSTCFIGWFIWSLVIWGNGQTPAKQILKMRVVSSKTGVRATWGHMAIRQFLIPVAFSLPFTFLQFMVNPAFIDPSYWASYSSDMYPVIHSGMFGGLASIFVYFISWIFQLADALWIFQKGENHRITDLIASTDVLNVSAQRVAGTISTGVSS